MKWIGGFGMAGVLVLVGCSGHPKEVRLVLDQPEAVLPGSFAQVSNVIEFRDGRLALADVRDRRFLFASFAGRIDTIGIHTDTLWPGDPAPGKHKLPGQVLHFRGDTVALVDFAAQRTTIWNEEGKFLAVLPTRPLGGTTNQALAYDTMGYAYKADYRAVMGGLEPGRSIAVDSAPVLRYAREDTVADTVARLRLPQFGDGKFGEEIKKVAVIFSPNDLFGVMPDGSLWVARASTNSLDWRSPSGTWTRGESFPYPKVRVTQADKDRFMDAAHRNGLPSAIDIQYPFADYKPPFLLGLSGRDHQVWLQRARPAGDSVPVYDVLGQDGRRLRVVQLPAGVMLEGFGKDGAVYAAIRNGDGRQKVVRFRLPG